MAQRTVHLMPLGQTAKDMGNLDFLGSHLAGEVVKGTRAHSLVLYSVGKVRHKHKCTIRASVSPLSRLIRGFRKKYLGRKVA